VELREQELRVERDRSKEQLWKALFGQARAERLAGQRWRSLELLKEALPQQQGPLRLLHVRQVLFDARPFTFLPGVLETVAGLIESPQPGRGWQLALGPGLVRHRATSGIGGAGRRGYLHRAARTPPRSWAWRNGPRRDYKATKPGLHELFGRVGRTNPSSA
jgi:hypothetical protein